MAEELPKFRSIRRLWELFDEYREEVEGTNLTDSSKKDYVMFAEQFIRWIEGNFEPGSYVR